MSEIILFPAIDLRQGQVVRLRQGDPVRQSVYSTDPGAAARRWLSVGARWLHVVNLDGAFGEKDSLNQEALGEILTAACEAQAQVQFGGGLRSLDSIARLLELGVARVVLGTLAVEQPSVLEQAVQAFGPERVAAGIDAYHDQVQVRGWKQGSALTALKAAQRMKLAGLQWLIFTDIDRDGMGSGVNLAAAQRLASATGLQVVVSGGAASAADVYAARQAGLAGIILGRALYDGTIDLGRLLESEPPC
jgi:phosphoribosylformimino-5-aminoimidazole carboxamide ribotide isomerase